MEEYIKKISNKIEGGKFINNSETASLKYFALDDIPPLFCKQHRDILADIIAGKEYIYR